MSSQVPVASIQSYSNMVMPLLQQKGSKLMSKMWKKNFTGKAAKAVEQIGKQSVYQKTTRHADVQYSDTPHSARWIHPTDWAVSDLIDTQDKLRMLIDATPAYAESMMNAMGRKVDKLVLDAATGTAYTGENGTTTEAFDSSYQIAAGGTGLTHDKLLETMELMMGADWDSNNDSAILAVGSKQYRELLDMTQVISADFNGNRPVLQNGKVTNWLGFEIVRISDDILNISGTDRSCIAFAKSGLCLGIWNDITTKVDDIPTKHYATQVLTEMTMGASRIENGRVIEIICSEA